MKKTIILIPVYNDKGDLLKTLNSINEDDDNFEILIIDDGSVIPLTLPREKYKFKINVFRLSENMGITKALNTGLDIISNRKDI
ncbi:TPA: glycosyltransferase, partial [Escherichia coli]|nr:glycosyltransferase [Escherichia coli]